MITKHVYWKNIIELQLTLKTVTAWKQEEKEYVGNQVVGLTFWKKSETEENLLLLQKISKARSKFFYSFFEVKGYLLQQL
jgi:hypothetical protein